jgi:hypothetical protein
MLLAGLAALAVSLVVHVPCVAALAPSPDRDVGTATADDGQKACIGNCYAVAMSQNPDYAACILTVIDGPVGACAGLLSTGQRTALKFCVAACDF